MDSAGKPPLVTANSSNGVVHVAAAGATPFNTIATSSNGNLDSECSAQHHEPYGHLSPPTRRTSNELEDDTNEATTTAGAAATTNGVQYEQRISLSPVPRGPPGLEDTTTTQHYYSSTIAATPQKQQQQLTKTKRKPTEQQNQKSKKYNIDDGEQFDVPSSIILTEFSGSSVDDELLESDSEESSAGRTHRLQQLSGQIHRRNQEKMRCVVDVCRKLKVENRNLRGSVKKQHRELTGYRSMHSSMASMPADYTIPPLSARGERNGSTNVTNNHSRTPSNIIEQMYPHSTPPICPKQEDYCGAPITLEAHKKSAPEHKKCLSSLVNTSFGTNNNNGNNTSDPTNTSANANATPEQLLLEQINSIGVPSSSSSPEQCIELLRHLLLRTMLQCRAGEEVIQELERERRGTAITFMRLNKENAELVAARDEADGKVSALEGQQQQQTAVQDDGDRFEESGSIAAEVGGGTAVTNGTNRQHNNSSNEEGPSNHHPHHNHPEAQRQSSTMRRKGSAFHLSQRHVAGGHFSTDSSAPVSPAHHAHSNASGGYGLSSNGGAVGSGGRRTSSSALTGAGGAGGAASFVRSLSADRSVASSTKHGGAGGTADRPGTPASTSVGFRRSRPVPQHPARGGGSTQLESSTLDDANTSGDIHASADHPPPQLSASVKLHTTPAVPALRRIATSPTIQAKRSPRGAPSTPSTGVKNTTNGVDTAVRSGVRTPISTRHPGHSNLQQKSGVGGGGRTTSPTTRTPLMGSSTLRSTSAAKRTPITTSITTTPSQSLRPAARPTPTTTTAMNGSRTTSPATTTNGAHRSNLTTVSGSGGTGSKSAAVGTPKAAGASSSKIVPVGSSRDKQRAMLSHSPTSKLRGVTPTTPSGRRPIGSNGDAVVSKVNSHRNSVGTSKVNTTTSRTTGTDSSARKALASSPLR